MENLDFNKAVEMARSTEVSNKQSVEMQKGASTSTTSFFC